MFSKLAKTLIKDKALEYAKENKVKDGSSIIAYDAQGKPKIFKYKDGKIK